LCLAPVNVELKRTMTNTLSDHLLTVLIPNYNYAEYIGKAIESVLAQDYPAVELIIVDDGSDDNSVAEIQKILKKDNHLHNSELIVLEENRGKLGAINAAISKLNGEYIITLDADDWLSPSYASRCIAELRQRRLRDVNLGFIYSDCHLVDQSGKIIDHGRSTSFKKHLVGKLSFLPEPALMLTRAFTEVAPFDETIRVATKHHKWCRVVDNGWCGHHIAEPLFYYRMHSCNMSGIGPRILDEEDKGEYGERILSGYWDIASG
jgi:alpha-1,3-rhamnosyltransferase